MQSHIYSIMRLPIERTANTTKGPYQLTYITSHTYDKKKINGLFHLKSRSCRNGITCLRNIGIYLQDKAGPNPEEYHVNYHCHKAWRPELFSYSTWQTKQPNFRLCHEMQSKSCCRNTTCFRFWEKASARLSYYSILFKILFRHDERP